jgi:hypothetical protein
MIKIVLLGCLSVTVLALGNTCIAQTPKATEPNYANQYTNQFNLDSLLSKINNLKQKSPIDLETRVEILTEKQNLGNLIRHYILDVMEVTSAIDRDLAETDRIHDHLVNSKQKADRISNFLTFVATGSLGLVRSGMSFNPANTLANNVLRTTENSTEVMIPTADITRRYRTTHTANKPNMLARIFDKPVDSRTNYNETVWKYLNSVPQDTKTGNTRKQDLINNWIKQRDLTSPASPKGKHEIDLLTGTCSTKDSLNISLLEKRSSMLSDLRAEVVRIYRILAQLDDLVIAQ